MREKVKAVLSGNQYKDDILGKMQWTVKEKRRIISREDISISVQNKIRGKQGDDGKVVCFTFRNDCPELFTDSGYVQFCVYKNRVFFRQASNDDGYKITNASKTSKNRYVKIPGVDLFKDFVGDYELKYDSFLELYYVEKV